MPVLSSTGELFLYIKRSLNQCSAVEDKETLLQLSKVFEATMVQYSDGLLAHVVALSRARSGAVKPLSGPEELVVAAVINTCEYSSEVMEELEATVVRLVEPALATQVAFADMQTRMASFRHTYTQTGGQTETDMMDGWIHAYMHTCIQAYIQTDRHTCMHHTCIHTKIRVYW